MVLCVSVFQISVKFTNLHTDRRHAAGFNECYILTECMVTFSHRASSTFIRNIFKINACRDGLLKSTVYAAETSLWHCVEHSVQCYWD